MIAYCWSVTRSTRYRSCETTMRVPGQESSRSSIAASISVSTSLVGSSRINTFGSATSTSRNSHPRREVLAGESESLQQLSGSEVFSLNREGCLGASKHLAHPVRGNVRKIGERLVENAKLHRFAPLHPTPGWRDGSREQSEQSRLPRPVRPENRRALARRNPPLNVLQHPSTVKGNGCLDEVDDILPEPGRGEP